MDDKSREKHDQKEKQWFQKMVEKSFRRKHKNIGNNATLHSKLTKMHA